MPAPPESRKAAVRPLSSFSRSSSGSSSTRAPKPGSTRSSASRSRARNSVCLREGALTDSISLPLSSPRRFGRLVEDELRSEDLRQLRDHRLAEDPHGHGVEELRERRDPEVELARERDRAALGAVLHSPCPLEDLGVAVDELEAHRVRRGVELVALRPAQDAVAE